MDLLTILIIISGILLIISIISIYGLFKSEYKIRQLVEVNYDYDEFYKALSDRVEEMYGKMKQIDNKGHFESDDEVGYFFKELKDIIIRLEKYIK